MNVLHLADDPQFSEDLRSLEAQVSSKAAHAVVDFFVRALHELVQNIAQMLKLRKLMITRERRLILCGVSTQVWGAFLVTGLDKVFSFSDNVPTALATVQMQ